MSKRRNCTFNEDLQKEFKFIKLDNLYEDKTKVICQHCNIHFSVAHGGRSDINQHLRSQKHKDAEKMLSSVQSITSFTVRHGDKKCDKIAASEALFAYHTVRHNQSFRTNDCLSKLIKKLYEPKFSSARTKSEAIIVTILSPYILNEVVTDLSKVKSITISLDASNKRDIKLFPIVVRYFLPTIGVQNKIIDFTSLPGETSEMQSNMLKRIIDKFSLEKKVVALCADNTNTNFGGCNRIGKNNVWRKIENILEREIIGIGCGAHIVHNCLQCAIDCLPFDIECFAVKIYKFFYIYTVRVEELKSFCDFVGENYSKLLEHGNTRFLSLGPSISKILSMFDGLRSYFLSQEKCPVMLKKLFEDPCLKLWLLFTRDQILTFQTCISVIERDTISATEVAMNIENLISIIEARKNESFITTEVKNKLEILSNEGEISMENFFEIIKNFYETSLQYLKKWKISLGSTEKYKWILLAKVPEWAVIQNSLSDELLSRTGTDEVHVFDQWALIKPIVIRLLDKWNRENISVSSRWVEIFSELEEKSIPFEEFKNIVEFVLCLPGSTSVVERIFSNMNSLWSNEKSRINVETVRAMLIIRQNCNMDCDQFYDKILKEKDILRKIDSSEKYSWYKPNDMASTSKD